MPPGSDPDAHPGVLLVEAAALFADRLGLPGDRVRQSGHGRLALDPHARIDPAAHPEIARAIADVDPARDPALELALALGRLHEAALAAGDAVGKRKERRRRGVFYTPEPLARFVLDRALPAPPVGGDDQSPSPRPIICDPACGAGVFLILALDRLASRARVGGVAPVPGRAELIRSVVGVDLDPLGAWLCGIAIWLWARDPSLPIDDALARVRTADALLDMDWARAFPDAFDRDRPGFDAVVGNPPYLGQLQSDTARDRDSAKQIRAASQGVVSCYADTAAAFWELGARLTRPGGRVSLVLPMSLLSTRDAGPVRTGLVSGATLDSLWTCDEPMFEHATVRVCVPTLRMRTSDDHAQFSIARFQGPAFKPCPPRDTSSERLRAAPTWSFLMTDDDAPARSDRLAAILDETTDLPTLGRHAETSADFRDEYYALATRIREHPNPSGTPLDSPSPGADAMIPLITCGLIDPCALLWSLRPARLHKRRWLAPCVRAGDLEASRVLTACARKRLVPKILVATQTRVVEAIADPAGCLLPTTPVLSIHPHDADHVWLLLAAVLSPVATRVALARTKGSALSPDAIKLSARQLAALPLPGDPASPSESWRRAAEAVRDASRSTDADLRRELLIRGAHDSTASYAIPPEEAESLVMWWRARLRPVDGAGRSWCRKIPQVRGSHIHAA